ncbi:MAG: MBL fold metallo-hydrolase [Armatimonadota bacterium]
MPETIAKQGVLTQVTPHLWVFQSHLNVGVIRNGEWALLIDFGNGDVLPVLQQAGVTGIDTLLFTHHHRDQVYGAQGLKATVIVPAAEREFFADPMAFWQSQESRWHIYNVHPHHQMLTEPIKVDRTIDDGDTLQWGPARITALATPGHTDGGMSYLVEVDGRRIAFSGDLIYDAGKVWELYSLQKGNDLVTDYHGFLGARQQVLAGLNRILEMQPDNLVPSHGVMMSHPAAAVAALRSRLQQCYDNYAAISALRWYFPQMFSEYAGSRYVMPIRQGTPAPDFLKHVGTTWVLISETGAAFVMDCGSEEIISAVHAWQAVGEITAVEGLWVTHYHDDHVEKVPAFQQAFDCELIADESVAQVIADPLAWRLPCISPSVARVDRRTHDNDRWQWHEFTMTAYHFPGQSLHHGGLLVEGRGLRMFFAGDSNTPAGIDDYSAQNRNFLGDGVGFDRCIALLQELKPDLIFNPHVDVAFDYTEEEYRTMRANLATRRHLFRDLFPWDDANYGIDEAWVYCYPYEQHVKSGAQVHIEAVVTNHSSFRRDITCQPMLPCAWNTTPSPVIATIPAKSVGRIALTFDVPADVTGRIVIPLDVTTREFHLPQFTEFVIQIG